MMMRLNNAVWSVLFWWNDMKWYDFIMWYDETSEEDMMNWGATLSSF